MKEIRRANLRHLLIGPRFMGDRAKFCEEAKITKGRLAQLLDEDQPFGDAAARNLCESLDLPDGYFSREISSTPVIVNPGFNFSHEAKKIAALYDLISESDLIGRAQAFSGATTAIVAVLEGHKSHSTFQPTVDQKKQHA